MDNNTDNLSRLLDNLRALGFLDRLFGWKKIKDQLMDAAAELQKLVSNAGHQRETLAKMESERISQDKDLKIASEALHKNAYEFERLNAQVRESGARIERFASEQASLQATMQSQEEAIGILKGDYRVLAERNSYLIAENKRLSEVQASHTQTIAGLSIRKSELEMELVEQWSRLHELTEQLAEARKQNTGLLKDEEFRKLEHSNAIASLSEIQNQIQSDRAKEVGTRIHEEMERLINLKDTWNRHEEQVRSMLKVICQKHAISYIDKVPFKGEPDNTLLVCDEYVIFDAKSPSGENMANFPSYLKDQAEKAKKYASQENVKTDIFFVVPSNALNSIPQFVHRYPDHIVYVISTDALEPIILSLKKIEEYEFVDQLSPEDRENVCRVLGHFAHLSKRRIQVDNFFARQFIELAYKCENNLPDDMLKSVIEFEKAGKLNPPMERRAKAIPLSEIEMESRKISSEADGRGILIQDQALSELFKELPLYKNLEQNPTTTNNPSME